MSSWLRPRFAGAFFLFLATASCVSTSYQSRDWSQYDGPGARYFHAEELPFPHVEDPLEPANRVSAFASHAVMRWVVSPVAKVYRFILPEWARTHLAKAGDNLLFPVRLVNNLLQGKLRESGVETARFVTNTTVGILGLFDPAYEWGLRPYPEDFGQTLAAWGWDRSAYIFIPVLGPSTVRDGLGMIPDALADPASYYFPASPVRGFNKLSNHIESDLRQVEVYYDAYEPARTLFVLQREVELTDFVWRSDASASTQTLSSIFLEHEDEDFPQCALTGEVLLESTGRSLPFSLWLKPEPAPLAYILPGFGGHRLGEASLALAEIAYRNGYSVVTVSSPTNWEFMRYGATVTVPGYGPVDSHDLHLALTAIDRQLEVEYPGRLLARRLSGISMGAYETLLIAAAHEDAAKNGLLVFDLYVAMNPPVSLEHALLQLDRFYNAPMALPPVERKERIEEIFAKVLYLSHGELEPDMMLPFTRLESEFLIGLSFRLDLQFLLLQSQELNDLGVLMTKRSALHMAPAFREASEYSYMEYFYAFVLPYYAARDPEVSLDETGERRLFERSDLRSVAQGLRSNERVRLFSNENDFLLRPEDIVWLRATLGDRVTLFPAGGHLGNLHREAIQKVIAATVQKAMEENGRAP